MAVVAVGICLRRFINQGWTAGAAAAQAAGQADGYELGAQKGFDVGAEIGFYYGAALVWQHQLRDGAPARYGRAMWPADALPLRGSLYPASRGAAPRPTCVQHHQGAGLAADHPAGLPGGQPAPRDAV